MIKQLGVISSIMMLLSGCVQTQHVRNIEMFKKGNSQCYNRATMPHTFVVDAHNHFRPFGGNALSINELNTYFERLGILFVNVFGIGQMVPLDCDYFYNCPTAQVKPSIKNDFSNAANYYEYAPQDTHLTLSMSFPDLNAPQDVAYKMDLLEQEYPNTFAWMGEVNLVKQALFINRHRTTAIENIAKWDEFMAKLRSPRGPGSTPIPISIHADIGSNKAPEKFLYLMEAVLKQYPDNPIVWVHMGLSRELTNLDPKRHIEILSRLLDQYPKLMLDISWRVLYDEYFKHEAIRDHYVAFFNQYSTRILPGSDFVATDTKRFKHYANEVELTSYINQFLDNNAFRNIALGQNYFDLMSLDYEAPVICEE
ncbi:amidohydrolase [Pseudoalteromonas sp. SMS1]|uniref:amidohydrolase n=1 Tax=Pseudoalteromonas sp. SMS1 TaxID=2908894 RepID=UPI001F19009F|nr:amidohydrolase [Pseudoalteromonas sp. SMS1]MCF2857710.1 amidohydrolase [Pseudoalteromonas sp. SMS1]